MAQRTTADNVKAVLSRDYDGLTDLQNAIDTAWALVDRAEDYADGIPLTVTTAQMELVERWLAAHFYAVSDRPYSNRSTQGASGTFDGQTAMSLDATLYGQTAKLIDPTGFLRTIGTTTSPTGKARVGLTWLGTEDDPTGL